MSKTNRTTKRRLQPLGKLHRHKDFRSDRLAHARDLIVWTPPGYDLDDEQRYPVVVMHDGQNLFDPKTSYIPGNTWAAHRSVSRLIWAGDLPRMILVGVNHTGEHRIDEYTPTRDAHQKRGGRAEAYGNLIVEDLLPWVAANYRTLEGPRNTALGGSSLGGLATLAIGLRRPDVFGALAAFSPSIWWDKRWIIRMVQGLPARTDQRIWLDMGQKEGPHMLHLARHLRDALVGKGWIEGEDLGYYEARHGKHTERAWGRRFGPALTFLARESDEERDRD